MTSYLLVVSILVCFFVLWLIIRLVSQPKKSISEFELNIALCESHKDVEKNVPYRLTTDSDNVVRIKQDYPLSSNNNWIQTDEEEWYVKVSGVSHRNDAVVCFIAGTSREIGVVKEPMPDYPHALAVYGKWIDKFGKIYKEKLGYVDDENAQEISESLNQSKDYKLSAKLGMMFIPTKEKEQHGLRINVTIFEPKR